MNKTITIILNETTFEIEDAAYEKLKNYLSEVEKYFSKEEAKDEIIKDIENNFASKLEEKLFKRKHKIILEKDIEDLICIIGRVEDFENESNKNKDSENESSKNEENYTYKKLYRNPDDVVLAGVCSGLAVYLGIEPNIIRILFAVFTIFTGFFPGFVIYFVLWAILPVATTGSQKLEMSGEIINLKNIKEKIYQMKDDIKKATMNESNKSYVKQKVRNLKREIRDEFRKKTNNNSFSDNNKINRRDDIFSVFLKVILIIVGISFVASAVSGLIGITVATSFVLFSPDIISHIINIQGIPYNFIQLICILGILAALIPLIFILITGISLLKRKNIFKVGSSIFLLVIWVFIVSSIIFFSIRYIPYNSIPQFTVNTTPWKDYNLINSSETNYLLKDFSNIKIEGPYSVNVSFGDEFIVKAKGEEYVLNKIKVTVDKDELIISPKDIFNSMTNDISFEIQLPKINNININGATKLNLEGFNNNEELNIELNGASFLKTDSYSKNLNIKLNGLSRVEFIKNKENINPIENLSIELNGASSADLLNAENKNSDVLIFGASHLKINTIDSLKIKADGASSIEYLGNPKMNQNIKGLSSVKKLDNINTEEDQKTLDF